MTRHFLHLVEFPHVGYYLAGVGLCRTLARRWPDATARWDIGLVMDVPDHWESVETYLLDLAQRQDWRAPIERAEHPIYGRYGRRTPDLWQRQARAWLAEMPSGQRLAELRALLAERVDPYAHSHVQIMPPPVRFQERLLCAATRRNYGLGALFPYSVPFPATCHAGETLSAWLAVLAWEAWDWLRPIRATQATGRHRARSDWTRVAWRWPGRVTPFHRWIAVVWMQPVALRRLPILWRGRGRCRGSAWSQWLSHPACSLPIQDWDLRFVPHELRSTAGSYTAEAWPCSPQVGGFIYQTHTLRTLL